MLCNADNVTHSGGEVERPRPDVTSLRIARPVRPRLMLDPLMKMDPQVCRSREEDMGKQFVSNIAPTSEKQNSKTQNKRTNTNVHLTS